MRLATASLVLSLALLCGACGAPQLSVSAGGTPDWTDRSWLGLPGYGRSHLHRPAVACDQFGRCWQIGPYDRYARAYDRPDAEPPGWADNLPGSARTDDRFLRPRSDVVCDRATRICYKRGRADQSDTDDVFGERAGDRVDALQDRHRTARVFVPERGASCDRKRRVCFEDGDPDRGLTRRYFGRRVARDLD
jgi:Fels-1 Prophage Protein-like